MIVSLLAFLQDINLSLAALKLDLEGGADLDADKAGRSQGGPRELGSTG